MDVKAVLLQRDRQSFDWLYGRYAGVLLGVIRKMVAESSAAESLLLETFVTAWRSLDQFEGTSNDIFSWMLRIARHKIAERNNEEAPQYEAEHKKEHRVSTHYSQTAPARQYSNL